MNNSDFNDFKNWQNGDDDDSAMNNPNNMFPQGGFFYYGPNNPLFKKMWDNANSNNSEDFINNMKEYLHMDDIFEQFSKQSGNKNKKNPKPEKQKSTVFSQEDYLKLIEIRGYLAITEQYAHVKALDKLINQIQIIPRNSK